MKIFKKLTSILNRIESQWSLWLLIKQAGILTIFGGLPAWITSSSESFAKYAPISWLAVGFTCLLLFALYSVLRQYAYRLQIRSKYDERMLQHGSVINHLDTTFEKKRILIDDFVLPSHPFIEGKTFIKCEFIGPANIYFHFGNSVDLIEPPQIDGVWLALDSKFNNGFIFRNCVFRNCSFQRITIFASVEHYIAWKNLPYINWISVLPSDEDIKKRIAFISKEYEPS